MQAFESSEIKVKCLVPKDDKTFGVPTFSIFLRLKANILFQEVSMYLRGVLELDTGLMVCSLFNFIPDVETVVL